MKTELLTAFNNESKNLFEIKKEVDTQLQRLSKLEECLLNTSQHRPRIWRLLANICLGFALENTAEEGENPYAVANFFLEASEYIKQGHGFFCKEAPPAALIKAFAEIAAEPDSKKQPRILAEELVNKLLELPIGERTSLVSGWRFKGLAHSIHISIEKTAVTGDGTSHFDLYIYNANGAGEQLADVAFGKSHSYPYLKFSGITQQELFFEDMHNKRPIGLIFEQLYALRNAGVSKEFNFSHFLNIFAPLCHLYVPAEEYPQGLLISTQKGGNCPVKAARCLALHNLGNRDTYKAYDLDCRFYAIFCAYKDWDSDRENNKKSYMLQQALMRSINQIDETYQHSPQAIISEPAYQTALATAKEMLDAVNTTLRRPRAAPPLISHPVNHQEAAERQKYLENYTPPPVRSPLKKTENTGVDPALGENASWENFGKVVIALARVHNEMHEMSWQLQYESVIQHLRPLKQQEIPIDLSVEICRDMLFLLHAYFYDYIKVAANVKEGIGSSPKEQNTAMETLAIAYKLAIRIDASQTEEKNLGILKDFGVDFSLFRQVSTLPFFHIKDRKTLEHRQELLEFFASNNKPGKNLFQFYNLKLKAQDLRAGVYPEASYHIQTHPGIRASQTAHISRDEAESIVQENERIVIEACQDLGGDSSRLDPHFALLKSVALYASSLLIQCNTKTRTRYSFSQDKFYGPAVIRINKKGDEYRFNYYVKVPNWPMLVQWEISTSLPDRQPPPKKMGDGYFKRYLNSELSSHNRQKLPSENAIQGERINDKFEEWFPHWINGLCVEGAQASSLLQEITKNLASISLTTLREIALLIYKTFEDEKGIRSPLFQQMLDEPLFLERIFQLGEKAFALWKNEPEKLPLLLELVQLQAQLLYQYQQIAPSALPEHLLSLLRQQYVYLEKRQSEVPYSTEEMMEKLITLTSLLLSIPFSQMSDDEKTNLFLSIHDLQKNWDTAHSYNREASLTVWNNYLALTPSLMQEAGQIALDCIKKLDPTVVVRNIDCSNGVSLETNQGVWQVDLINGTVRTPKGPLNNGNSVALKEKLKQLDRLGVSIPADYTIVDNYLRFYSPVWGELRVYLGSVEGKPLVGRFIDGEWHVYHSPEMCQNLHLNSALVFDHAAWVSLRTKRLVITDLRGKKLYETASDGQLHPINSNKTFLRSAYPCALTRFESKEEICAWRDEKGMTYTLPRFSPEPLFSLPNNLKRALVYQKNPTFHVDDDPNQPDWGMDRFINLRTEDGQRRLILVPQGKIQARSFSPACQILLPKTSSDGNISTLNYFTYEVQGDLLQPKSLDGRLYLAHLFLAQKKYQAAFDLLEGISLSDTAGIESWSLLNEILDPDKESNDFSPKAEAIRLRAFLRMHSLSQTGEELDDLHSSILQTYENYQRHGKTREKRLTLFPEENALIRKLIVMPKDSKCSFEHGRGNLAFGQPDLAFPNHFIIQAYCFIKSSIINSEVDDATAKIISEAIDNYYLATLKPAFIELYSEILHCSDFVKLQRYGYYVFYSTLPDSEKDDRNGINQYQRFFLIDLIYKKLTGQKLDDIPKERDKFSANLICLWQSYFASDQSGNQKSPDSSSNSFEKGWIQFTFPDANERESPAAPKMPKRPRDPHVGALQALPPVLDEEPSYASYLVKSNGALRETAAKSHLATDALLATKLHYQQELQAAELQLQNRPRLKAGIAREVLVDSLNGDIRNCLADEAEYASFMQACLDLPYKDLSKALHRAAKAEGQAKRPPSLEDVCRAATDPRNAQKRLTKLNPALSEKQLGDLQQAALCWMTLQTRRHHFEYIVSKIHGKCSDDELAELLSKKRLYSPSEEPFYLFFEWISEKRVRPKQKKFITEAFEAALQGKNYLFQLLMGEGKTSIFTSALLEMLANCTSIVPSIITHHSQLAATLTNLRDLHKQRYNKDLVLLNASLEECGQEAVLENLLERYEIAEKERLPLVMVSSFPLLIQLKISLETLRLSQSRTPTIPRVLELLCRLRSKMKSSLFLLDEVDSSLSMRVDVRAPHGKAILFPSDEAELIAEVYKQIAFTPELRRRVPLFQNEQEQVSSKTYQEDVLPQLADQLFTSPSLSLSEYPALKGAFVRWIKNEIPKADRDFEGDVDLLTDPIARENVAFHRLLTNRKQSSIPADKRTFELTSALKHFLKEIMPLALSNNYFRKYGPHLDRPDRGETVPYKGTGAPNKTKFSTAHLAMAYHLQACFSHRISKEEVLFLGHKMLEAAKKYAPLEKKGVDQTLEAEQFLTITGIELTSIAKPSSLEKAVQFVNAPENFEKKLALRAETAVFFAFTHPYEAYATGIDLMSIAAINIGCSGTIENHPAYHIKLGTPKFDQGALGRVLRKMLKGPAPSAIKNKSLESLIETFETLPVEEKSRLAGLIDIGGYTKSESSNFAAAIKLRNHFRAHPEYEKEAIVFLHSFSKKEQFAILFNHSDDPFPLENTSREEILKYNVPLEKIFYLWDELRTKGTDYPLPGSDTAPAILYATLNANTPIGSLLQGFMRCRGYLENLQEVRSLVSGMERDLFPNRAAKIVDIMNGSMRSEADEVTAETTRSYPEQLFSLLKMAGLDAIEEAVMLQKPAMLKRAIDQFFPYLFSKKNDFAYETWAEPKEEHPSQILLENLYKQAQRVYPACKENGALLLRNAADNPYVAPTLQSSASLFEQEVEVEREIETELELHNFQEELHEIQHELDLELSSYQNTASSPRPYKEQDWTARWNGLLPSNTIPVGNFLQPDNNSIWDIVSGKKESAEFAACFPDNILATENLLRVFKDYSLNIFDYQFKDSQFVLIVRHPSGEYDTVMLSKFDKERAAAHLKQHPRENTWLLNLQGLPEIRSLTPLPSKEELETPLWYANFFSGNVEPLMENSRLSKEIMKNSPLYTKYLLLKNHKKNPHAILQLLLNGYVKSSQVEKTTMGHLFSLRRKAQLTAREEHQATSTTAASVAPRPSKPAPRPAETQPPYAPDQSLLQKILCFPFKLLKMLCSLCLLPCKLVANCFRA